MSVDNKQLADILIEKKLIQPKDAEFLLKTAHSKLQDLEDLLFERENIPDDDLNEIISGIYQVPYIKLQQRQISEELIHIVPFSLASSQFVIPFELDAGILKVAINDPQNYELISSLERKSNYKIVPHFAPKKEIKAALKAYNKDVNSKFKKLLEGAMADTTQIESLKDAAKILDTIILFAFQNNASDIHIEPHKEFIKVRYRVDGILQTIEELPIQVLELLITRIKVLANLRTDEHRAAQDGRFKIELESNEITMRVSIVPTYDGEKTVLRILSSTNQALDLEALGYCDRNLEVILSSIKKSNGILLITGPTGSGKTTTLYSILKLLNSSDVNIATIEDPIEYRLEGINQIQVNSKANLTFANGLRALLRQDPDIIMVGEIRDEETASIAINAALTGHLVLATLHTNDVASTLPRLTDMDVEPFLISATVKMVLAQRLIRTICSKCKEEYTVSQDDIKAIGDKYDYDLGPKLKELTNSDESITLYRGKGCDHCADSGYKGRTGIAEVMNPSEKIKKLIFDGAQPSEIEKTAVEEGMITMFMDGLKKTLAGETTIEEIMRVIRS